MGCKVSITQRQATKRGRVLRLERKFIMDTRAHLKRRKNEVGLETTWRVAKISFPGSL